MSEKLNGMNGYLLSISDEEFQLMRSLIYERFGINLTEQKRSLLIGRLQKIIKTSGFHSFQQYYEHIINSQNEQALSNLIDRVSTNHTYFYREKDHFDYFLQTALPNVVSRLEAKGSRELRVWCAGCSSGEEPYMILMLMQKYFGMDYLKWDAGVLATDISLRALNTAKAGIYNQEKIDMIPEELVSKHFYKSGKSEWVVKDSLKKEATFRRFNLMNSHFPFKKPFQIIFCRNVMIYFDQPTRDNLVKKFYQFTDPGGYFFIGHSESLGRSHDHYQYVKPAVYQKRYK